MKKPTPCLNRPCLNRLGRNKTDKYYLYKTCLVILLVSLFFSCAPQPNALAVREISGSESTSFSGLGIESHNIEQITLKMVSNLLESDFYKQSKKLPVIILEGEYFINESSQIINTNLLADKMRVSLLRKTKGKIRFVTRANLKILIKEAETSGKDIDLIEADYRIVARISSISKVSNKTGVKSNYFQFAIELLDLSSGLLVWANIYDFKKIGADDSIYR